MIACPAGREYADQKQHQLHEISLYLFSVQALNTLTKNDISEVKGMKAPPLPVRLVMEAVCVLKSLKPTKMKDPSTGRCVCLCMGNHLVAGCQCVCACICVCVCLCICVCRCRCEGVCVTP